MENLQVIRTPKVIALEINSIKNQTMKIVLYNSIEIGRRLVEAKEIVGHGEWSNWLKTSVDYSQRTANDLMRIFNEYGSSQISLLGDNLNSQTYANLSYSQALALIGLPEENRENFVKENKVEDMSTRELKVAIKEKQKLEEQLKAKEEEINQNKDKLKKFQDENKRIKNEMDIVKAKKQEDLTNREVEIENLRNHINNLEKKLEVKQEEINPEVEEEMKLTRELLQEKARELGDAMKEIEELKRELEEKPIEINAEIPEEVERELQDLREKVNKATSNQNESSVKFKIYFNELGKSFNDLLKSLGEIEEDDTKNKYSIAVKKLINDILNKI